MAGGIAFTVLTEDWLDASQVIIALLLIAAELVYSKIADKCNIIDKPNERSSHSTIILRGGRVFFAFPIIVWAVMIAIEGNDITHYLPFLFGLLLIAGVYFWDDVHSLPDSIRLVVQFIATALMFWSIAEGSDLITRLPWYWLLALSVVPLILLHRIPNQVWHDSVAGFIN